MTTANDQTIPRISWEEFFTEFSDGRTRWQEDQHVTLIGPTGSGKTVLAYSILPLREYVTILATKPTDVSLTRFAHANGFRHMTKWEDLPIRGRKAVKRRLVWPKVTRLDDKANQGYQIHVALYDMFEQQGWTIYIDEMRFVANDLGLKSVLNTYLLQYRAMKGGLVAATQRPSWVPLEFYSQASHLFFWRQRDRRDLDRISGIGSVDPWIVRQTITQLGDHEFLYLHVPTGNMSISKAPKPEGG